MQLLSYLSLLIVMFGPTTERHAVYISVVEIDTKEIRVKVFSDDLRDAIRNYAKIIPDSIASNFCKKHKKEIQQYFREKLTVTINGELVSYKYRSATQESDSYWMSFDFEEEKDWKSIRVEDKHFMELFPTQSNIIKVNGPVLRFERLNINQTSCSFEF